MSTNAKKKSPAPRQRRVFGAKEKCEAVLAVWSERRTPTEVCRELGIPWQQLNAWQKVAMEALLKGLEPRQGQEPKPALSPRVQTLMGKIDRRFHRPSKLEKRLETIQQTGPKAPPPPSESK